jgi:hypothetical protein
MIHRQLIALTSSFFGFIYKQKSTKKIGFKYKQKLTKSTLINATLPKTPLLIILFFKIIAEFQYKFNTL